MIPKMPASALQKKYRSLIDELADLRHSSEESLVALERLLQEFHGSAAALGPELAAVACDKLADQLEAEAHRSVSQRRKRLLLTAVDVVDHMTFPKSQP